MSVGFDPNAVTTQSQVFSLRASKSKLISGKFWTCSSCFGVEDGMVNLSPRLDYDVSSGWEGGDDWGRGIGRPSPRRNSFGSSRNELRVVT